VRDVVEVLHDERDEQLVIGPIGPQLEQQALGQVARADARRLEALDQVQHVLELIRGGSGLELDRHLRQRDGQPAAIVERGEDRAADGVLAGRELEHVELPGEVLGRLIGAAAVAP
jgi:hypothetical protein